MSPGLSIAKGGSSQLVYCSSLCFCASSLSQSYFCFFLLFCFLQAPTINPLCMFVVHFFVLSPNFHLFFPPPASTNLSVFSDGIPREKIGDASFFSK